MLKKITLADYELAMASYRRMAIDMGAIDVIQCGSVRDPGVSDIDCILVIKDWSSIKKSVRLLNPEMISPLFTHGPFVCNREILPELMRYTTLRPMKSDKETIESKVSDPEAKFITAARQSRSVPHFQECLARSPRGRNLALLLKSLLYTLRDCSIFCGNMDRFNDDVRAYEDLLDLARAKLKTGDFDNAAFRRLHQEGIELLQICKREMAQWIQFELNVLKTSDECTLRWFSRAVDSNVELVSQRHELRSEVERFRRFQREIDIGYGVYGALWRGAEYPFHHPDLSSIGARIWIRRLIKRWALFKQNLDYLKND